MSQVNFNAGATVHMLDGDASYARGGPVGFTTLGTAIEYVLSLPEEDRPLATIAVGHDAGTAKTLLRLDDIQALADSPDFPG